MSDKLADFFRCVENAGRWEFQVGIVTWDGPHTPEIKWKTYRTWMTPPNEKRLQKARSAAIAKPRFFRTCTRCGELKNTGHMLDKQICQFCAERHFGVVY